MTRWMWGTIVSRVYCQCPLIALATQTCRYQQGRRETSTSVRHNPVLPGRKYLNYCYHSCVYDPHALVLYRSPFLNNNKLLYLLSLCNFLLFTVYRVWVQRIEDWGRSSLWVFQDLCNQLSKHSEIWNESQLFLVWQFSPTIAYEIFQYEI